MPQAKYADAIALLKADHRTVEKLFYDFRKARDPGRKLMLAQQICIELKVHMMIEEELFYPAFRGKISDDTLDEAYVEHDGAKILVNDISQANPEDPFFEAKLTVLAEEVEHHVHEEEARGKGMFAQCRATTVDLVELRDQMLARKLELMAQAKAEGLPPAQARAVNLIAA